jgi:hypothetical protein
MVGDNTSKYFSAKAFNSNIDNNLWISECTGIKDLEMSEQRFAIRIKSVMKGHTIPRIKNLKNSISVDIDRLSSKTNFLIYNQTKILSTNKYLLVQK